MIPVYSINCRSPIYKLFHLQKFGQYYNLWSFFHPTSESKSRLSLETREGSDVQGPQKKQNVERKKNGGFSVREIKTNRRAYIQSVGGECSRRGWNFLSRPRLLPATSDQKWISLSPLRKLQAASSTAARMPPPLTPPPGEAYPPKTSWPFPRTLSETNIHTYTHIWSKIVGTCTYTCHPLSILNSYTSLYAHVHERRGGFHPLLLSALS